VETVGIKNVLTAAARQQTLRLVIAIGVAVLGAIGCSQISSAVLAPGYGPIGSVDPGFSGYGLGHVAVEDTTGNVLAADPNPSAGRVIVLAPDFTPGGTATVLTEFAVPYAYGVAVDQSAHAVYVSEGAPANKVERFVSDGAPVPTYTVDATFPAIAVTNPDNQLPVAVDAATHDLLVGDGDHINRYDSAGVLVRTVDGSSGSTPFRHVLDIAVASSKIYVVDYKGEPGTPFGGDGVTRVLRFAGDGSYERTIDTTDTPTVVAVEPGQGRLITGGRTGSNQGGAQLTLFENGVPTGITNATPAGGTYLVGLASDGGGSGRLYLADASTGYLIHIFAPAPGARVDSFTTTDPRAAQLTGTINPEGKATTAHFEYCSERDPCASDASVPWSVTPDVSVGSGSGDVPMPPTDITGLLPHTEYQVRISATDTQTSDYSNTATVTTADSPPVVVTGGVPDVSSTTATVSGTITPLGIQSTYYFEYGETTSYGSRAPVAAGAGVAGNGFVARPVRRGITDLKSSTTYHYRLVSTNTAGSTAGADMTFTTDPVGLPSRGYEMVSPVNKQGTPVDSAFTGTQAGTDGNSLLYGTAVSALPGAGSALFFPKVLGTRSASTWESVPLDLPLDNLVPQSEMFAGTFAVSDDGKRALVISRKKLTDDAVQGGYNLYIREPGITAPEREYTLVATDPLLSVLLGEQGVFYFVGASDDLHSSAFVAGGKMYEAVLGHGLRLVSRLPDGSSTVASGPNVNLNEPHQISSDGARIFFSAGSGGGPLYVRENGTTTIPISVSQRPNASSTPVNAIFLAASADGRFVEFTTDGFGSVDGLTSDAPDGPAIYRYDVDSGHLDYIIAAGNIQRVVAQPERNMIFYGVSAAPTSLYLAHDGAQTLVANVNLSSSPPSELSGSPNGRYYAFATPTQLTSYDNSGHLELYLYDADTGNIACPSCRTDGGAAVGDVGVGLDVVGETLWARYKPRAVLDDGTVFFDTPDPLVGSDVNGTRDVYSVRGGHVTLISRGELPTASQFRDATPDGSNVFFVTNDQLVGQDVDTIPDMYDSRVAGGLPGQSPKPGPAPCVSSECREAGSGPVTSATPPSEGSKAPVVKPPAASKPKVSILTSSFSSTTLKLVVQVTSRGRIRASGARVTATVRTATGSGKYTLKIPLSRKTRAARKAHHQVKVAVKVALTPPFAAATTATFSRMLGK
jgi:hypothetical protein